MHGRFRRIFTAMTKTQSLVLDDWGPERLNAILDRLVHNAYRLELDGQSFRKKDAQAGDETLEN